MTPRRRASAVAVAVAGLCAGLTLFAQAARQAPPVTTKPPMRGVTERPPAGLPPIQTGPVTIDFEDIVTTGLGQGGQAVLTSQYAVRGVTFNRVVVIDYSKGLPVAGFAHSGTRAIEQCYAMEFCTLPIEARFRSPQTRVKVWVGYSSPRHGAGSILLVGQDASGTAIVRRALDVPASLSPTSIRQSIEIAVTEARIQSITVMALAQLGPRGLAVDDIEFENTSAQPPPPPPSKLPDKPIEPPPVVLSLKLTTMPVIAGEAAGFVVSAEGPGPVPRFVFNPGDGTDPRTLDAAAFTHTYRSKAAGISASVNPVDAKGPESAVVFDVEEPPPAPIALSLTLVSAEVVAGQAASFAVSVPGGGAVPAYVLNAGDGSVEETLRGEAFTHVFPRAGQYSVSVRLLPGVAGTGASVRVDVSAGTSFGIYAAVALLALVGGYVALRARKGRRTTTPGVVTLHARPRMPPRFNPDKPPGVDLEVRLVKNLARMRFTPRVLLQRRDQ